MSAPSGRTQGQVVEGEADNSLASILLALSTSRFDSLTLHSILVGYNSNKPRKKSNFTENRLVDNFWCQNHCAFLRLIPERRTRSVTE